MTLSSTRVLRTLLPAAIGAMAMACGSTPTTPAAAAAVQSSQFTVNTIAPGGNASYFFSVSETSTVGVTLASIANTTNGDLIPSALTIALGTPSGTTCTPTTSVNTTVALAAQITKSLAAGAACVKVTDVDGLPLPATVAVRISATTGTTTATGLTGTESFASELQRNGTSTRTFRVFGPGNMAMTMTGVGGLDKVVRLGLGVWDGSACRLMSTADTPAGSTPQIVAGVDPGMYCLSLKDIGMLTGPVNFSVSIEHP